MFSNVALRAENLSKKYRLYARPIDRLKNLLPFGWSNNFREYLAVKDVSFELQRGEVLGIIGTNGSGKSTLLQLISGVLNPTAGEVIVNGRIAALLELGAGFNPEFTGRENIYLNAAILGLDSREVDEKINEIIEFSGVGAFIDQPVKTYSSGMYVRLAFSIATSVEPDILIVDEALSVGDGAFARKSFDRIMQLKQRGATILFCSHNIYQVEALCQRVLWLDKGDIRAFGEARAVCQKYNEFLDRPQASDITDPAEPLVVSTQPVEGAARLLAVEVLADGRSQLPLNIHSMSSTLEVRVKFASSPSLPTPSVAVVITDGAGRNISSCSTHYDHWGIPRDSNGDGFAIVRFPEVQLLRGEYVVNVFLMCEQAIHIYDSARCAEFTVTQPGLEIGVVSLRRMWSEQ